MSRMDHRRNRLFFPMHPLLGWRPRLAMVLQSRMSGLPEGLPTMLGTPQKLSRRAPEKRRSASFFKLPRCRKRLASNGRSGHWSTLGLCNSSIRNKPIVEESAFLLVQGEIYTMKQEVLATEEIFVTARLTMTLQSGTGHPERCRAADGKVAWARNSCGERLAGNQGWVSLGLPSNEQQLYRMYIRN